MLDVYKRQLLAHPFEISAHIQPDFAGIGRLIPVSYTHLLLLSRNVETTYMPPQEYLDRQDRYNLIFFLDSTNDPQHPYICLQMKVNGLMIRINNAELDK